MSTETAFEIGDRVVVESPIENVGGVSARRPEESDLLAVGMTGTVVANMYGRATHRDGDVAVCFDGVHRRSGDYFYVMPEGLLRVDDLDALAAERAPRQALVIVANTFTSDPHGFPEGTVVYLAKGRDRDEEENARFLVSTDPNSSARYAEWPHGAMRAGWVTADDLALDLPGFVVGDRVRVADPMKWKGYDGTVHTEPRSVYFDDTEVVTVVDDVSPMHADNVVVSGYVEVLAESLTLVEDDEVDEVDETPAEIGTATLRIDVRFFVGDVDVTDRLGDLAEVLRGE